MNIKAVVKVMNFHSLLRVDASRRRAERYEAMKGELESMMAIIQNNRNLRLDKYIKLPNPSNPVLRIYIGSDYGFCGNVNSTVLSELSKAPQGEKILVGRKIRRGEEQALFIPQEELGKRVRAIRGYFERAVKERPWSAVELVYNHYYNMSSIKQEVQRIYPLELNQDDSGSQGDFVFEGDPEQMLQEMVISYMTYELLSATASSYASENIMRQNATSESLKKLDELEAEELRLMRKERSLKSVQRTTDSYIKQKSLDRGAM